MSAQGRVRTRSWPRGTVRSSQSAAACTAPGPGTTGTRGGGPGRNITRSMSRRRHYKVELSVHLNSSSLTFEDIIVKMNI